MRNDIKRKISNLTLRTILNCFERSCCRKPIPVESKVMDWKIITYLRKIITYAFRNYICAHKHY